MKAGIKSRKAGGRNFQNCVERTRAKKAEIEISVRVEFGKNRERTKHLRENGVKFMVE